MAAEWVPLCCAKDLAIDEPYVSVVFANERRHRISVKDEGDAYSISAFVVRQAVVASLPDLPIQAWLRNRTTTLVGFRIDRKRRLIAEAWVPKVGLTPDEFQFYVRTLAVESDRFEYILTGRNIE
jgi:hypothetical protein